MDTILEGDPLKEYLVLFHPLVLEIFKDFKFFNHSEGILDVGQGH